MTLLSMCQDVAREVSLAVPNAIVSDTTNSDAMTLLRIAQKEGYLHSQRHTWDALKAEHTFLSVADYDQGSGSLPADFDRWVPMTFYDRTERREIHGPADAREWQEMMATLTKPFEPIFRRRGGRVLMAHQSGPYLAGHTIAYEYVSKNWCIDGISSDATARFANDSDTVLLNEDVFTLGMIWRWKAHKGMEHETVRLEYERAITDRIMNDGGKPTLDSKQRATTTFGRARIADFNTVP